MNKVKKFFNDIWNTIDPIVELAIYVLIAQAISKLVGITFMQSMFVVFGYFILNIMRILAIVIRNRFKKA